MQKNVIILSGSPRKGGNSDVLCDQFMKGAIEAGHFAEKVSIAHKKIHYCTGCGTCFNMGKPCPQKDDMNEIMEKMIKADVIVMASPVYFYTMNAQMKTLIDRTCSRYTEMTNKEFYFIVTAADNDIRNMERTIESFRGFTFCLEEAVEKGIVYGISAWQIGEIKETAAFQEAYRMGKSV